MNDKNRTEKGKRSGFTLLEVMVAVAIMAIALVAVLGSQSQSVLLASEGKFNTTAALLAQMKMAEMNLESPENLTSDSGTFGEDFPDYNWETAVNDVTFAGTEQISRHLIQVDLKIFWGKDELYQYHLREHRFVPGIQ